jgi:hypothetical protein
MVNQLFRNSLFILLFLVAFMGMKGQTLKISDPVKYNDYIVDQQNVIGVELLKLIDMFGNLPEDKTVATDQLEVILTTCNNGIINLQNLKPINNEFGMRQAAVELFQFYIQIMDSDYRTVLDQLYLEEPDAKLMQEILTRITESEGVVDEKFQSAQSAFAKYHNIQLEQNELQEEFEESGE